MSETTGKNNVVETTLKLKDQMTKQLSKISKSLGNLRTKMQETSRQTDNMDKGFSAGVNKMVQNAKNLGTIKNAIQKAYKKVIGQADAYTAIQSRLAYINDGTQTTAQLNDKLFASAQKARVSYESIASTVGNLGLVAKKAFTGNDEMIQFSELMAKSFKIAGISTEEQSEAMEQLTQAMAGGKLKGDQMQTVLQKAPVLAEAIAKELGVSVEQLKDMSEEGKVTSDVMKNALFHSAEDIDDRFSKLPMTFQEAAEKIKSTLIDKLRPTFEKMSSWLNSEEGARVLASIGDGIARFAERLPSIMGVLQSIISAATNLYNFMMKYKNIVLPIGAVIVILIGLAKTVGVAKLAFEGLKVAGMLLNAAMNLSPYGRIALAIAAVVAAGVWLYENWDVIKAKASELWEKISSFFGPIRDAICDAFTTAQETVQGFFTWIDEKLSWLGDAIKGIPIIGSIFSGDNLNGGNGGRLAMEKLTPQGNALGTSYWRGGLTHINERGGEIVDLPNGSRVIPADKSQRMLDGRTNNVTINISGMSKSTAEIMGELVPQLKLAMANI